MLSTSSTVPASTRETRGSPLRGEYSMATRETPARISPKAASRVARLLYTTLSTPASANLPAST